MNILRAKGRCGRVVYFLVLFLCGFITNIADILSRGNTDEPLVLFLCFFVLIACVWSIFYMGAKRCHDIGLNGWWQLIPFFWVWLLIAKGDTKDNKYGPAD